MSSFFENENENRSGIENKKKRLALLYATIKINKNHKFLPIL